MFGGFKARLTLFGGKNKKGLQSELSPDMTVSGAYRTSRDDFFGYYNSFDQSKKTTASEQVLQPMRPTKSVNDLTKNKNLPPNLRNSNVEVSRDPRGAEPLDTKNGAPNLTQTKNLEKEQKKLEKQRLAEQKVREKKAAQEQAKQEKLNKEKEKREAQQVKAKREKKPVKKQAPQPQAPIAVAQTSGIQAPGTVAQSETRFSTNTLESSISKSSGPPPYSIVPPQEPERPERTKKASHSKSTGNVSFNKPEDKGSWDIISQHREQINRPTAKIGGGSKQKQMVMDLNYNFENTSQAKDNSDA